MGGRTDVGEGFDRPRPDLRLFVALSLTSEARAELASWAAPLVDADATLRAIAPESLHLTLVFLGSRPAEEVPEILAALEPAPARPESLTLVGTAYLPSRTPTVLVVDVAADPTLLALQAELAERLAPFSAAGRPERRAFRPHVTLARIRRGASRRGPGRPARHERPLPSPIAVDASGVALYRSHPGSRYERLG